MVSVPGDTQNYFCGGGGSGYYGGSASKAGSGGGAGSSYTGGLDSVIQNIQGGGSASDTAGKVIIQYQTYL
jgi:hypothetical protein